MAILQQLSSPAVSALDCLAVVTFPLDATSACRCPCLCSGWVVFPRSPCTEHSRRWNCGSGSDILRRAVLAPVLSVPRHENGPLDIDRDTLLSRADCRWTALGISIRSPLSASGYALDVGCA